MLYEHIRKMQSSYRKKDYVKLRFGIPVPQYLYESMQEVFKLFLVLLLFLMLVTDPIFACMPENADKSNKLMWDGNCDGIADQKFAFSFFAMLGVFTYFGLCMDLSVIFTRVSAYVLVCTRMVTEVALFLLAIFIIIFSFGGAMSCLKQDNPEFRGLHHSMMSLLQMVVRMYS